MYKDGRGTVNQMNVQGWEGDSEPDVCTRMGGGGVGVGGTVNQMNVQGWEGDSEPDECTRMGERRNLQMTVHDQH